MSVTLLSSCALFQSRVNDETRALRTVPSDPVWDLDLYELRADGGTDTLPPQEVFQDSGRYYSFHDRILWAMIDYYVDSVRIATTSMSSTKDVDEWYRTVRPRLYDSLYTKHLYTKHPYTKHPGGAYHRFEGELHFTNDTTWRWLGDQDSFETCRRSMTLAQLLKPGHWYLFIFDSEGPTHSIGRGHYTERRAWFYLDPQGEVKHWGSVRRRLKKMRIV